MEWITGLGTASRSDTSPLSGETMPSTARYSPPVGLRMSWRIATVSCAPMSIDE